MVKVPLTTATPPELGAEALTGSGDISKGAMAKGAMDGTVAGE
jgi:hypothetical protein